MTLAISDLYLGPVVEGIDVSTHQGEINWEAVAGQGAVKFCIVRTGDGRSVDRYFARNFSACKRHGIPVGTYRYLRAHHDQRPIAAMDAALIAEQGGFGPFDLSAAIDIEAGAYYGLPGVGNRSDISASELTPSLVAAVMGAAVEYLETIESATGRKGLVYGGSSLMAMSRHADLAPLARWPLWRPDYAAGNANQGQDVPVRIPAPWTQYTFHQYGTEATGLAGFHGRVDRLRFRGNATKFFLHRFSLNRRLFYGAIAALGVGAVLLATAGGAAAVKG